MESRWFALEECERANQFHQSFSAVVTIKPNGPMGWNHTNMVGVMEAPDFRWGYAGPPVKSVTITFPGCPKPSWRLFPRGLAGAPLKKGPEIES